MSGLDRRYAGLPVSTFTIKPAGRVDAGEVHYETDIWLPGRYAASSAMLRRCVILKGLEILLADISDLDVRNFHLEQLSSPRRRSGRKWSGISGPSGRHQHQRGYLLARRAAGPRPHRWRSD